MPISYEGRLTADDINRLRVPKNVRARLLERADEGRDLATVVREQSITGITTLYCTSPREPLMREAQSVLGYLVDEQCNKAWMSHAMMTEMATARPGDGAIGYHARTEMLRVANAQSSHNLTSLLMAIRAICAQVRQGMLNRPIIAKAMMDIYDSPLSECTWSRQTYPVRRNVAKPQGFEVEPPQGRGGQNNG